MLKIALLTSLLTFSVSPLVLQNNAPFNPIHEPNLQSEPQYYTDYIDLSFFDNLNVEFVSAAGNQVNFFRVTANATHSKLVTTGVYSNKFKYWESKLFVPNSSVSLEVILTDALNDTDKISLNNKRLTDKKDQYGFSLVTDFYNNSGNPEYNRLPQTWLAFPSIDFVVDEVYEITMTIPYGNLSTPPNQWQNLLRNMKFFNQKYYDYLLTTDGDYVYYENGYTDGYVDGNNDGLTTGYENGYNAGYNDGAAGGFTAMGWLTSIFAAMGGLLSIQLMPGVSIGGIVILIMVLTLLPFLIGLLKGGKD